VLDNNDAGGKIRGNLRQDELEGVRPAGRNSDGDDAVGRQNWARTLFGPRIFGYDGRRQFAAGDALRKLDLVDKLVRNRIQMASRSVDRLGNEIDSAECESF